MTRAKKASPKPKPASKQAGWQPVKRLPELRVLQFTKIVDDGGKLAIVTYYFNSPVDKLWRQAMNLTPANKTEGVQPLKGNKIPAEMILLHDRIEKWTSSQRKVK